MGVDFSTILPKIYELLTVYGIRVIAALAIFIIGRWVAKGIRRIIRRMMTRSKVDPTLISRALEWQGSSKKFRFLQPS